MSRASPAFRTFSFCKSLVPCWARHYFWKRYGKQQWRQYAMVLFVGFGVGMALVGMFSAALSIINKAVSSLAY